MKVVNTEDAGAEELPTRRLTVIGQKVSLLFRLTRRETEILLLVAEHGYSNREIAEHCVISEKTAKIHLANVMNKMGVCSMRKLHALLLYHVLVDSEES